jgi:RNA polymerase sigma-70 factor (ECF subfamily)
VAEGDLGGERRFRREQRDFDGLFRAHYPEIVRYLSVRLGSREEAADLASEVFLEAFKRVPGLRWRGKPVLAWLYRVAANMAADSVRKRSREVLASEPAASVAIPDPTEGIPDREALARALQSLPPDYQLVVHLRLVEGYSFAEVARLTGKSVGSCQMLMLRSSRRLKTSLEQAGVRVPA